MNLSRLGLSADWQDNIGTGNGKPASFRGIDIWVPIADDRGPRSFSQISVRMSGDFTFSRSPAGVPEPDTWLLWLAGLGVAGIVHRNSRRTATPAQL
ncbi:MAG: PEP-CTERM sorting domain-containing protein [Alphaproteobacteria bacterium]|nr:PEP-CTERM sorting domain-containing protein [Alphaproteobacteria bacterium]